MKTSFYFFFWFIIYFIFGLTGIPFLMENGFIVALLLVFGLSYLDKRLFARDYAYQAAVNMWFIFETYYSDDAASMLRVTRRNMMGHIVMSLYCLVMLAGIISIGDYNLLVLAVFGLLCASSMSMSVKLQKRCAELRDNGLEQFGDSPYAALSDQYSSYCSMRQQRTAQQLKPEMPRMTRVLSIVGIVFALGCIGGGLFYALLLLIGISGMNTLMTAILIWALLAIYYGVRDIVTCIQTLRGRAVPTIR